MGSRKLKMMKLSCILVTVITGAYMVLCGVLSKEPSATVMMTAFGALGLGHSTANWANAKEHEAKK